MTEQPVVFDTKIAMVVRRDLEAWCATVKAVGRAKLALVG